MGTRPRVGMGFLVEKDKKLLCIRRKHSHGKGTWAPPGGHLNFGEAFEDCALRKVIEDTGIAVSAPKFEGITNDLFVETGKHYVTIWMTCTHISGDPMIGSAREVSAAGWHPWDDFPTPLFLTFRHLVHGVNAYGFEAYAAKRMKLARRLRSERPIPIQEIRSQSTSSLISDFESPNVPRVGVGLIVSRDEKILLLKRTNPHGRGTWSPPGGHMEYAEAPEEAAARELEEETGLAVTGIQVIGATNDIFEEAGRHYITVWMQGECSSGVPKICRPEEIEAALWFAWHELPEPLFLTFRNLAGDDCYWISRFQDYYSKVIPSRHR